ncbi:baeRF11 domain-containing protein [Nocardia goodfellowii]
MLHTDIPTSREIAGLADATGDCCVSIYTPTEPSSAAREENRIAFQNQVREAVELVDDKAQRIALEEQFDDLMDDADFWRFLANTLVVFATPTWMRIFRIPNRLAAAVTVDDRFLLKPLLRATTFAQTAFVLALSEGSARLVEITPDSPVQDVRVPEMPSSAADYARRASLTDRSPKGRIQGGEGKKVLIRQYARAVDRALRDTLAGEDIPLILAAPEPVGAMFRAVNRYPGLLDETITGNPEHLRDVDLDSRAREILDRHYAAELADLRQAFEEFRGDGRATADVADIARAATFGNVDTVMLNIEDIEPGTISPDTGAVAFAPDSEINTPGVLDEVARRVLASSGRVLALRSEEIPDGASAAAILRYPVPG